MSSPRTPGSRIEELLAALVDRVRVLLLPPVPAPLPVAPRRAQVVAPLRARPARRR